MVIKVKIVEFSTTRIKNGFSQRGLAKKAKVSHAFISQLESGDRNPGPKIAKRLCEVLDTEFDHIFFVENVCNSKRNINSHNNSQACAG